jgi:hypothetical protein
MKAFAPFLMIPALGLAGWWLATAWAPADGLALPTPVRLEPPPALGVVIPPPMVDGPVQVKMDALLPPAAPPPVQPSARTPSTPLARDSGEWPVVQAILVDGTQRVAQVNGQAMVPGDWYGALRLAAIEPDRVLFEKPTSRQAVWVNVSDR